MGDALLCSYYSLYFIQRGVSDTERAILLALIPFSLFVGCLLFSALAKSKKTALWLYRVCMLIEAGLVVGYAFCDTFLSLTILTPIIGIVNGAPFSLIEGYLVPETKRLGGNYSSIRLFGSMGYAVSLAAGSVLLTYLTIPDCHFFAGAFFVVALVLSFLLPKPTEQEETPVVKEKAPLKAVLNRGAILFILFQFLFYGAWNACTYLFPVRLIDLGWTDAHYSLARSIGVVIEMVSLFVMPFVGKIFKNNNRVPLYLSCVLIIAATTCAVTIPEAWAVAYTFFILSSLGKAFLFAYQSLLLQELVGEEALGRVLTIAVAGTNLASAVLNLFSTSMVETFTFPGYFLFIVGFEALGAAMLLFLPRAKPTEDQMPE